MPGFFFLKMAEFSVDVVSQISVGNTSALTQQNSKMVRSLYTFYIHVLHHTGRQCIWKTIGIGILGILLKILTVLVYAQ